MTKEPKKELVVSKGNSPAEMIRLAVTGGADLEKLEKLLTLQERWEVNEAKKAYNRAMADFKANAPNLIDKESLVDYTTRQGIKVKYKYATLANVIEKITEKLSEYGLSASWRTKQDGMVVVTCCITHVAGHSEETTLSASADTSGSKNPIQAIGSTITYLERYTLLAMLGIATYDQDDDARTISEPPQKQTVTMPEPKEAEVVNPAKQILESTSGVISKQLAQDLVTLAKKNGYTKEELYEIIFKLGYTKVVEILQQDYGTIFKELGVNAEEWRKKQQEEWGEEINWGK